MLVTHCAWCSGDQLCTGPPRGQVSRTYWGAKHDVFSSAHVAYRSWELETQRHERGHTLSQAPTVGSVAQCAHRTGDLVHFRCAAASGQESNTTVSPAVCCARTHTAQLFHTDMPVAVKDAIRYPVIGSAALLSLFVAIKFLPKNLIVYIITGYFCLVGIFAIGGALLNIRLQVQRVCTRSLHVRQRSEHCQVRN